MLEAVSKRYSPSPAWGLASLRTVGMVHRLVLNPLSHTNQGHLLGEFHLLIQEVALQEITEVKVFAGRAQGMQIQNGPQFRLFSMAMVVSMAPKFPPTHLERLQREVRCRRPAEAGWQQPPYRRSNSDRFGSSRLFDNKELRSKNSVWLVSEAVDG